jgi:hypothetical protein
MELAGTRESLAAALEVNETNQASIKRLERSIENADKALAGMSEDRTTLNGVRIATRQAVKEVMRDETFKLWYASPAHNDAWRLLREAADASGNGAFVPSVGAAGGLPANADTGERK